MKYDFTKSDEFDRALQELEKELNHKFKETF